MELQAIRNEVINIIADDSYDATAVDSYINQCIDYLNSIIELPGRKSIASVDTVVGQAYTGLTSISQEFNGRILSAICADGNLDIYLGLESLFNAYATGDNTDLLATGTLEAVAVEGNTLWYQKVPTSETTITVVYYRDLAGLSADDDELTDVPKGLHRQLLVFGTAWLIFDQIEEDVEQAKVNARSYFYTSFDESNKHSGITKLREWIGRKKRHLTTSVWSV